jgi:hypothetical protein
MPRKPTSSSVTSTPCRCAWLKNAASDPEVPVKFDHDVGEYQVEHRDGGYSVVRHCPWCGGAAPASMRASLFATLSSAELRRLGRLTARLKTVEDAVAALGEPDLCETEGLTIETPSRGRRPARVEVFPTMTFSRLSKVADVTLADHGPKGIGFSFSPKFIGKPEASPRRRRRSKLRRF